MKYRFEKMTRKITPEERKKRSYIIAAIITAVIIIVLILFGVHWYKVHVFKQRVSELKTVIESGKLVDACRFVRYRDRDAAIAAARWAETTGNNEVVSEMQLLRAEHSPKWTEWTTDIKFTLNVTSGYDKFFIRALWVKEQDEWVLDLAETHEYMPIDNATRGRLLDTLQSVTSMDLDQYLNKNEYPPE
jgi:hypothetical protein